ncbi:hypothetical protein FRC03_012191 [Tulasnella sp. 419]|nr:hypothetical protein FRC03_012191 [Tulasnella sp. 419]
MIDYYGTSNFKAFTDCGLDLGWSHPNASNPPHWPDNDCYHTCNTGCTNTGSSQGGSNNNSNNSNGSNGGSNNSALKDQSIGFILSSLIGGALAISLLF